MAEYTPSLDELKASFMPSRYLDRLDADAQFDRAIAAYEKQLRAEIAADIRYFAKPGSSWFQALDFSATIAEGES